MNTQVEVLNLYSVDVYECLNVSSKSQIMCINPFGHIIAK